MKRRTFVRSTMAAATATALPTRGWLAEWYRVAAQDPGDLDAVTGDGKKITLRGAELTQLVKSLKGPMLLAKSEGYDEARRVLNPSIDKHPALIVQATGNDDVKAAIDFARAHSILLAVKCGGHSFGGQSTCDNGMMIDLSKFRAVRVDPKSKKAWVTGGTLLGAVDREAQAHELVTPMGTVSHTGVGGLTTGAGFGRVARRFGLALDNVTAVDVISADGVLRHANATENEDLYWAVRGGGGNFGVVTSFEFALHPMGRQIIGGGMSFPMSRAKELLEFYADYSLKAPEELYLDFGMALPPGGGEGGAGFSLCYSGPPSQASRVLEPIRRLKPIEDSVKPLEYVAMQRSGDVTDPRAMGSYLKSGFIAKLTPELIAAILAGFKGGPNRLTQVFFQHCGGAIGRVAPKATAFAHRYANLNLLTNVSWKNGDEPSEHIQWIKKYWDTLEPFTHGFYSVEVTGEEAAAVVNANYRENYPRLVAIKNKYDPGNLFRLNANVKPT